MFQSVYGVNYKWFPLVAILLFKMAVNKMKKNAYISSKLLCVSIFSEVSGLVEYCRIQYIDAFHFMTFILHWKIFICFESHRASTQ